MLCVPKSRSTGRLARELLQIRWCFSPPGGFLAVGGFFATCAVGGVVPAPLRFVGLRLTGAIRQILTPGPHTPHVIA